jgi:hypothetical protein
LAVVAPAAEDLVVAPLYVSDPSPLLLLRQRLVVLEHPPVLVEQLQILDPGDNQDARLGKRISQGQPGIVYHSAGERLHGEHADVLVDRFGDDRCPGLGFEKAEIDHDDVEKAIFKGTIQHVQTVTGDAYVANQAFIFGLAQGLQRSSPGDDRVVVGMGCHAVALVYVDVVSPEFLKAGLDVGPHLVRRGGVRLGGEDRAAIGLLQGQADPALAGGVAAGGIDEIDPSLEGMADSLHRFCLAHPLNRQASKAEAVGLKSGPAQRHPFHMLPSHLAFRPTTVPPPKHFAGATARPSIAWWSRETDGGSPCAFRHVSARGESVPGIRCRREDGSRVRF